MNALENGTVVTVACPRAANYSGKYRVDSEPQVVILKEVDGLEFNEQFCDATYKWRAIPENLAPYYEHEVLAGRMRIYNVLCLNVMCPLFIKGKCAGNGIVLETEKEKRVILLESKPLH